MIEIADCLKIPVYKNSALNILSPDEAGITLLLEDAPAIVFDDRMRPTRIRFTIAHELGHILLSHPMADGREQIEEKDADMFAARLLAPACVLWGLGAYTTEQISRYCDISYAAAELRAANMYKLQKRNKFLTNSLEKQVYAQFLHFMKENRM